MPGVSSYQAIQANHKFMVNGAACAGKIEGNPVREDIEEAAKICGIDFILNVVLNEKKEIVYAVAGDYIKAHGVGCEFINKHYLKEIDQLADIVLVSPGGSPKDINLYQAQKAIDNAKYAVKNGGVIILIASCKEGLGNVTFENWLLQARQPSDLIDRIKSDFQLGGHKAAAISMVLQSADIYLVSEINDITKERIFLRHFQTAQDALNAAFEKLGQDATVLAMPFGSSTLPMLTN